MDLHPCVRRYQVVYLVDVDDGISLTTDAFHDTFQPLLESPRYCVPASRLPKSSS